MPGANRSQQNTVELLPCPFCGGRANIYENEVDFVQKWSVGCGDCNANLDVCEDERHEAAEVWNTRAPAASTGEPVAWIVERPNDPTFPRLYRSKADADAMVAYVNVSPLVKAEPLYRTCAKNAQVASGDVRAAVIEALGQITDLTVALRQGGPDPDDLQELSEALETATNIAYEARAALSQAPATDAAAWSTDFSTAPTEMHDYFLLRPQGISGRDEKPFLPTIVQRIDGEIYTTDNEVEPVYFGQNEPDDSPLKTTLEWRPLPADWGRA